VFDPVMGAGELPVSRGFRILLVLGEDTPAECEPKLAEAIPRLAQLNKSA
jgi:hypothetical protein